MIRRCRSRLLVAAAAACATLPVAARAQVSVDFPLGIGIRAPTYDRVDGLTLPYGPDISVGDDQLVVTPTIAYRTHLGSLDPSLDVRWRPDSLVSLSLTGARGTFSNDRWIRSDLINSVYALALGVDSRNDFRADRAEGKVALTIPTGEGSSRVYAGVRFENDWSTGWLPGERHAPFAFYHRHDTVNGIDRPNPPIDRGHVASLLVGGESHYESERISNSADATFEGSWEAPVTDHFQQVTLHDQGTVRTWWGERLDVAVHLVTTPSGPAPRQRYAYLGGSGTLATVDLFTMGGDHLYFVDAQYAIPIPGAYLPILGELFVAPRFVTGAAAVGGFGRPVQNAGVRLGSGIVRLDCLVNPRTHQGSLGVGLAFSR